MKKKKKERIQWKNQFVNFIAIILGIYVAYWLTNVKEARDLRTLEKTYLENLAQDLTADIESLRANTDTLAYYDKLLQRFSFHLSNASVPSDSATSMVAALYAHVPFIARDNTYQAMLGSGKLDVINEFQLRQAIVELYNQHYRTIKLADDLDINQKTNLIYPYLMEQQTFGPGGFTNFALLKETKFVNLVFASSYTVNQQLRFEELALEKAEEVLDRVKGRIGR